jgi:hypothetical protein
MMVSRAAKISAAIIVLTIIFAALMYVTRGVGPGFTGVPRLLTGSPLYDILNPLLAVILFILLGLSVYYLRKVREQ